MIDKAMLSWRDLLRFNGTSDTSAPSILGWLQLHRMLLGGEMYSARSPLTFDTLASRTTAALSQGKVPIAIMNIYALSIKDSAFSDSILGMSTDRQRIIDLPGGLLDDPYQQHRVFLSAAARIDLAMDTVQFVIDTAAYYVSNAYDSIRSIQVDFDDGAGYRTVSSGSTVPIWYSTGGAKVGRIRMIVGRTTADTLRSAFKVDLEEST